MIPLSTIVGRVRTRYEQSSTVRWSNDDIKKYINEGLESLAEASDFYERYVTIPLESGRRYYDLRGFTPETVVGVKSVWSSVRNDWLQAVDEGDLQFKWEESTGDPQVYFTRGIYWLGLWPCPSTDTTGYVRVYFAGIPYRYTIDQAVLSDLPDDHIPALEEYALHEMAMQDGDVDLAMRYWASYREREKKLSMFADHRLDGGTTSLYGGFTSGHFGGPAGNEGHMDSEGYI